MNPNLLKGLDIGKIIGGINKTLEIANKAIPLYNQVKPILQNASSLTNIIKIINTPDNKTNTKKEINETKKVSNNNLPTFFQ